MISKGNLLLKATSQIHSSIEQTLLRLESQTETPAPQASRLKTGLGIRLSDLVIRTKDKREVEFVPNAVQTKYADVVVPRWRDGSYDVAGLRELILKARQEGFSTLIEALLFCDTLNTPNTETVVIAHDADTTQKVFRMVRRFYENLPDDKRPATKYASKTEYYWPEIGSSFYVGTAGARQFGRGTTVSNVHATEVAFWPDAASLVAGLLEAVPESGAIFIESTANGFGNYYQTEWDAAYDHNDSVFKPRFYAWFELPEYRREVPEGFEITENEQKLKVLYSLDDEQICFYREKAKTQRGKLKQEYPSNPREAFLSSGNPYFNREVLAAMEEEDCEHPGPANVPREFERLCLVPDWTEDGTRERSEPDYIAVWRRPEPGRRYVVCADPAEGIRDETGEHDFCGAHVLVAETWEQVAELHGRWETHEFGLLLAELGWWYNLALIGVERNNHGHAVLNALIHAANYPLMGATGWGGVYTHEEFDRKKKRNQRQPGWPTTPKTKYFSLDKLAFAILDRDILLRGKSTIGELFRFVKKSGGKAGGDSGSHDDRVTSLAIGIAIIRPENAAPPPAVAIPTPQARRYAPI